MAVLRYKDISKMSEKEREIKLTELKMEMIKSGVTANKATAKTKEIKRAISRLIAFNMSQKDRLRNK
ncbi:MAG: hypothetical protein AABW65_02985 [Nanoarchaeota archaeon]